MLLSLTGKRWIVRHHRNVLPGLTDILIQERNLSSPPLCRMEQDVDFGQRAISRIKHAIERNERVGIFGDYDCDGITASLLVARFFKRRGIDPRIRLPLREEGYGIQTKHIDEFAGNNISLLITVDTGITAFSALEYASESNIDVIIIDHHTPPTVLPPAYAIVHPHLTHPALHPDPSAAGLCYLLIRALEKDDPGSEQYDIALASLGTIADCVELKGINRSIVEEGIVAWNHISSGPLHDLKVSANLRFPLSSTDIAFRLAPRVNAAGRLGDPLVAFTALLEGGANTEVLSTLNSQRQMYTESMIKSLPDESPDPFICAAHADYHPGLIGLMAGKLTERFSRPSLVAHIAHGICTASLRSIPSFNVVNALTTIQELLISFGGHAQAAGCTFQYANFERIQKKLSDCFLESPAFSLHSTLSIDAECSPADMTLSFCKQIQRLEPFGQGNPNPRFLLHNVSAFHGRCVGNDQRHLQCRLGNIQAIGFDLGKFLPYLSEPLDIACHIGLSQWQGNVYPQIFIDDLRVSIKTPSIRKSTQEQAFPL